MFDVSIPTSVARCCCRRCLWPPPLESLNESGCMSFDHTPDSTFLTELPAPPSPASVDALPDVERVPAVGRRAERREESRSNHWCTLFALSCLYFLNITWDITMPWLAFAHPKCQSSSSSVSPSTSQNSSKVPLHLSISPSPSPIVSDVGGRRIQGHGGVVQQGWRATTGFESRVGQCCDPRASIKSTLQHLMLRGGTLHLFILVQVILGHRCVSL
jgi:hypothetical protein